MKKWTKVVGLLILAVLLALSTAACGKDDETDAKVNVVTVSSQKYSDADKAIAGYVAEELALVEKATGTGSQDRVYMQAELVKKESKGTAQLDTLVLTDAQKEGLKSAEGFAVTAKFSVPADSLDEDEEAPTPVESTLSMYVLQYGDADFRFMVPVPAAGERVTNSYVKSVYNMTTHANYTVVNTNTVTIGEEAEKSFVVAKYTATATEETRYNDEARFNARTPGFDENTRDNVTYEVEQSGKVYEAHKQFEEGAEYHVWTSDNDYATVVEMQADDLEDTILEYIAMFGLQGATKTATGAECTVTEFMRAPGTGNMTITIENGKLTKIVMTFSGTMTQSNVQFSVGMDTSLEFTDFGTTTVSVPQEATSAITAYIAQQSQYENGNE